MNFFVIEIRNAHESWREFHSSVFLYTLIIYDYFSLTVCFLCICFKSRLPWSCCLLKVADLL